MSCESDPSEYGQSAYLCELLLVTQHWYKALPAKVGNKVDNKPFSDDLLAYLLHTPKLLDQGRPAFQHDETEPLGLAAAEKAYAELLNSCRGRTLGELHRGIMAGIEECIRTLKTWIRSFCELVTQATGRPRFDWIELADSLGNVSLPVRGPDGRLERVQRICDMLDDVIEQGLIAPLPRGGQTGALTPTDGFFATSDLAKRHGIPEEKLPAFEKALERWRKIAKMGADFIEHDQPSKNAPRFHYKESAVMSLIREYISAV